ncbi:hypothetical protein [Daejeonella lutea]|uniref:Cytochrome C and Quinol oxidase polypeptide I n=1 Tax=Daejeonella lutea TaxID=572036 RepID=A0A1T5A4K9_9SPHI|nr:hypothetical protein [Daejeonella lutea]SKB29886.1 hypothetical protein SAMN05661099_0316 [Daejeonella lutea]
MSTDGNHRPALYRLVIAHYLISAMCFAGLAVMMFFAAGNLTGHYFHPQLLAITHMAALGWASLIIFGAVYQLLPVILETELYSYRTAWLSLILFLCGLILMVYSFWNFEPGLLMQCGSFLLFSGILLFGLVIFLTARKNRDDIHQEFIITAVLWLIATALLGTILVFNFRYAFLQKDHLLFLKLHAHMGLAGWFLMLITGVSSKLIPMFLVSKEQKRGLLSWTYYLINAGLIFFVTDTYFFGLNIRTYFAALIVVSGIVCWLCYIAACFKSRIRRVIDLPMLHTLVAIILLSAGIIVLPVIVFYHLKSDPQAAKYTTLYGSLLLMGWISSLVLGQSFKTLPYIVWAKHYQHLAGKMPIPLPAELFRQKWLKVQFILYVAFVVAFFMGMLLKSNPLINIGLTCFLFVSLLYLANILVIIFHQPPTKT